LHFVLFITLDKGLRHMLVLTTLLQPVRRWILSAVWHCRIPYCAGWFNWYARWEVVRLFVPR